MSEHQYAKKVKKSQHHPPHQTEEQQFNQQDFAPAPNIFNLAHQNQVSISSPQVMQLQRTLGNRATLSVLQPKQKANDPDIMRLFGFGKKKYAKLGDDNDVDEDTQSKMDKLKAVGDKLKLYHDIHTNYKRHVKHLSSTAWNWFNKAWSYVNKALKLIAKLDPSGITAAVAAVSKLVQKIVEYVTEAARFLRDNDLVEQLSPLLPKELSIGTIKEAVSEVMDFKKLAVGAYDAVTAI